jgi:anti-sigma-K factor RskA
MNAQQIAIFEDYFRNTMPLSQRAEFEKSLQNDAELAAEYQSFCLIIRGIEGFGREQQMKSEDQEFLIFNFLNDNLTAEKRAAVLERIRLDEEFAKEVEESRLILQIFDEEEKDEALFQTLDNVRKKLEEEGGFGGTAKPEANIRPLKRNRRLHRYILAVAASIVAVISIGIGYWQLQRSALKPQHAWTASWLTEESEGMKWVGQKKQMMDVAARGYVEGNSQSEKSLLPMLTLLEAGEWGKAIDGLNQHLGKYPEDYYAQFALAQALICNQDTSPEGIKVATDILEGKLKDEIGHEEAIEWSLALAYLRLPEKEAMGMQILDEIMAKGSDFAKSAEQLKKEKNED